ncbi:MAG: ECF-type sigma factor [Bacteroidota bacterium]
MAQDVVELILKTSEGKEESMQALYNMLYDDLKKMAHRIKIDWRQAHTLNATALVHESYLKILSNERLTPLNKLHFYRLCGRAMRYVLQDYLEKKKADKRNAELTEINDYDQFVNFESDVNVDNLETVLHGLKQLENEDQVLSQVVECRFFSDMTIGETAEVMGISQATVKRKWSFARAYLSKSIKKSA